MLVYILKSTACLAILYVFYNVFLEKESIHRLKRFYLLGALLFSLIVPALVYTEYVESEPINQIYYPTEQAVQQPEDIINVPTALETGVLDIAPLLWSIYFIGLFFFGIKFLRNLLHIFFRIRKNPKHKLARITQVLLQEKIIPHTFMSYIFLNKSKFESNQIPKEVLLHEETHAKQKHTWDVLFVELLQVIFWVNPLIYLSKKAIKLNHEFLADQSVLENNIDQTSYKNTLLSYLSPDSEKKYQPLSNAINYSSIKKRFKIMKKQTSKKGIVLRSTVLLPLLAILLYGFSETKIIVKKEKSNSSIQTTDLEITPEIKIYDSLAKKYNAIPIEKRNIPLKDLNILETIYRNMSAAQKDEAQPFPECLPKEKQEDATKKQIVAYNKLAKKYNTMMNKGRNIHIVKSDVDQLNRIYELMTESQKVDSEPFPKFPEPPQPPKAPRVLKGEKSTIPPPPIPKEPKTNVESSLNFPAPPRSPNAPKALNTSDFADNQLKEILKNQDSYDHNNLDLKTINGIPTTTNTFYSGSDIENIDFETQENMRVYIHNSGSSKKAISSNLLESLRSLEEQDAQFYYDGKIITAEQGFQIIKKEKDIKIETLPFSNKQPEVRIYKENNDLRIPPPPSPPTPPSPLDFVINAAKKGATFMYEGKAVSSDKAIDLLRKNKELNIESRIKNGKQIVRITKEPVTIE
ncbi:Signal transducer regulating beta-lactamase production, contains metallopeptidase domain [Maribacter orientalis]|uniref:Signal transducer regulating beta-lactamase production, contains metallopeptidase domain n=1 Tax=Maribacter orientalis TaxID=228957 RepID=A0A1H7R6X7_9FLAO|nr:M56 family metallopeptidase [Maribacter orientalis]SEL55297.1 Signal transducer regulating beta-lactamase production, contains metallopeptidase domain [Maribacter orientalis]